MRPYLQLAFPALIATVCTQACRSTRVDAPLQVVADVSTPLDNESAMTPIGTRHTVRTLAKLPVSELLRLVRENGVAADCIPESVADGRPGLIDPKAIDDTNLTKAGFHALFNFLGAKNAQALAGVLWKGKVFKQSAQDCTHGTGTNRIARNHLITMKNRVFSRDEFITGEKPSTQDEDDFRSALQSNKNGVNLIELDYSQPDRDILGAARNFGIRDVMVPIRQDDGSLIFIGRAYAGDWDEPVPGDTSGTHVFHPDGMLAWFFLDFDDNSPLTVSKLAEMEPEHLLKLIEQNGTEVRCIPQGSAAGQPGRVFEGTISSSNATRIVFDKLFSALGTTLVEDVAGALWKGKTFHRDAKDCAFGTGTNKIAGENLISMTNRVFAAKEFLKDSGRSNDTEESTFVQALEGNLANAEHQGVPGVNLVELNYSNPAQDPFHIGKNFGIRDVMVPILQKDGTVIYVGRAYAGDWATDGKSFKSNGLIAWFFLDFDHGDY
jgi:hypothetical protein